MSGPTCVVPGCNEPPADYVDEGGDVRPYCPNHSPFGKVWDKTCSTCGDVPVVRATGLCGPCTFGESDTAGGEW